MASHPQLRQRLKPESRSSASDLREDAEVQLKRFIETNGHFSLVRNFHLADAFTLMNGFCGAQSIYMSGRYILTSNPLYMWAALWFPFFGAIFDLLDGKIARWRQSSSMLGQELDSLADLVSFGVAPTVAAFAMGMRNPLDTMILTVFVCSGIARLARFNITAAHIPHDAKGKAHYFEGLPIPSSLALIGFLSVCLLLGRFETSAGVWAATGPHLPFTGTWHNLLPGSGLPLGTLRVDMSNQLYALLATGGYLPRLLGAKLLAQCSEFFGAVVIHKISFLWLVWSMAMVSKTLRVPKP